MKITSQVINDLLPTYLAGEASPDTRELVDAYLREHPEFRDEALQSAAILGTFNEAPAPGYDAGRETQALRRTKKILSWQRILFAMASTFTLNAVSLSFSFEISAGRFAIHFLALPGQTTVVAVLLVVSAFLWLWYLRLTRRINTEVLH